MAHFTNVVIRTNLQQDLYNTHCSVLHIHKIFLNLIGNALEAVSDNGLITISTENCRLTNPVLLDHIAASAEDYVKITLVDNGVGVAQKDLDHIFDPFYTTKVMGKSGTGLGLSIVWNIVREHDGWLEVQSQNPGTSFEIYLPATFDKCSPKEEVVSSQPLQGNGETILLIDDQPEQNDTMGKLLEGLGYKTYSATSGEEGIAFLESREVDLVLLDMIMGDGLNGRETYERILQVQPGQKAIIISGYSKDEDISKARDLGVTHFLEKPVTLPKLSFTIRQLLSSS